MALASPAWRLIQQHPHNDKYQLLSTWTARAAHENIAPAS